MTVVKKLPYSTIPKRAPIVAELTDWDPRSVLWTHEQVISESTWRIIHNINSSFAVHVKTHRDVDYREYQYEIVDQNTVLLHFASPQVGYAQLLSRNGTKAAPVETLPEERLVQVSQNGNAVLFDVNQAPTTFEYSYDMEVITPDLATYSGSQVVSDETLHNTSWRDVRTVILNDTTQAKVYNLRPADMFVVPQIGDMPDGSTVRFVQQQGRNFVPHELWIAVPGSTTSNAVSHRVRDRAVDVGRMTRPLLYTGGELFAYENDIRPLNPPIRVQT